MSSGYPGERLVTYSHHPHSQHHARTHGHHHHGHDPSHFEQAARARWEELTGASDRLGWFETLAVKLSAAQATHTPQTQPRSLLIFAADHGFTASAASDDIPYDTRQTLRQLVQESSAVRVLSRLYGVNLRVFDVGISTPGGAIPGVLHQPVRPGTRDFTQEAALTIAEVKQAMKVGADAAGKALEHGDRLLILNGFGQGSATSAAALAAWVLEYSVPDSNDRGQGRESIESDMIQAALKHHRNAIRNPVSLLACLGGLETAALAGTILQATAHHLPVWLGGLSAVTAAAVAARIDPHVTGALFASGLPDTPYAAQLLNQLNLDPLPRVGSHMDEAAKALLTLPLLDAATALFNGMKPAHTAV